MTSKITIYKTKITPDRNCIVDDLSTYLSTCTVGYTNATFSYLKINLDLMIKVPISQSAVGTNSIGNYVKIEQYSRVYYYFLLNANWISESCVELELSMDTLNTFNGEFTFSPKTNIIRQHKNRWRNGEKILDPTDISLHKVIDKKSEEIPVNYKIKDYNIKIEESDTKKNQHWYLIYRTDIQADAADNKPLDVLLVPENKVPIDDGYVAQKDITTSIGYDNWRVFLREDNPSFSVTSMASSETFDFISDPNILGYAFKRSYAGGGNTVEMSIYDQSVGTWTTLTDSKYSATWRVNRADIVRITDDTTLYNDTSLIVNNTVKTQFKAGDSGILYSSEIKNIDRSMPNISNIFELPYVPCDLTWTGNVITLPNEWFVNEYNEFQLRDYTEEFEHKVIDNLLLDDLIFRENFISEEDMLSTDYSPTREPKLLHSDFTDLKLNYDSFNSNISLERIDTGNNPNTYLDINFKPSCSLSGQFCFKWDLIGGTYKEIADYEKFLITNTNTGLGLYNSDYLNYLRTGYNYDKKSNTLASTMRWIGAGTGVIGMAANYNKAISNNTKKSYNSSLSTIALITTGVNVVNNVVNSLEQQISQYQEMQKKLDEYSMQGASISASNSVDILKYYNGNKLRLIKYIPTEEMTEILTKMFHYTGYSIGKQELPNTTSRRNFNFLMCEPVFTNEDSNQIWTNYLDDIKSRFSLGVTYYHNVGGQYDWEQNKENWETSLFE